MSGKPSSKYPSIMLIDDNEIDNFINQKMIEGCNFSDNIYIHTSSKSALEFLKNLERGGDKMPDHLIPEIIFLDINMPIMDGFQFIGEFEKFAEAYKDKIKVVMLSTSINPSDIEAANKNKHILKFINKPLTKENLDDL